MTFTPLFRLLPLPTVLALLAGGADASVTSYCTSTPNSAGSGAHIAWAGPVTAQAGALVVSGAPSQVEGFYLYSLAPAQTPFGDGFLCVGSQAWYLARKRTDAQGTTALRIAHQAETEDLRWLNYPVNEGVTWHFQYFYRDANGPGGTGFNSTDAVAVVFE